MAEFYKNSLDSTYIKQLLSTINFPICPYITDGEIMLQGNIYIYIDKILKCTKSGIFYGARYRDARTHLTASEIVKVLDDKNYTARHISRYDYKQGKVIDTYLSVTDDPIVRLKFYKASYTVIEDYSPGASYTGLTQKFFSRYDYYDPETHKYLGEYLRFLKNFYSIDLMTLYNCYCHKYDDTIDLTDMKVSIKENNKRYKTTLIPIKYNTPYTIALQSSLPVYIKPVIYKNGLLQDDEKNYICEKLLNKVQKYNNCEYSQPIHFEATNLDESLQPYERYLYLAIQLNASNESTITVIEADTQADIYPHVFGFECINHESDANINKLLTSNSSMLQKSTGKQKPFSDKLLSYLLQHSIDARDEIDTNFTRINNHIGLEKPFPGQYSRAMRYYLYKGYMELRKKRKELNYNDILGYVDIDIENAIDKGFM